MSPRLGASQAKTIVEATLAHARAVAAAPLAVTVVDDGGHVVASLREDGAGFLRIDIAFAKAWGALGMGQPSRTLARRAAGHHNPFFVSLTDIADGRLALAPGGVLCSTDGRADIVGAVGVSGDTSEIDERCAVAGIESVGLVAVTDVELASDEPRRP